MVSDISVLPEGCISNLLSLTSPQDVYASSSVSFIFKCAADSDIVWEKFLPSDYKEIVSKSVSPINLNDFQSKKNLFIFLCNNPILIDGGKKSFKLEKRTGKKCFMTGARELDIAWGDNPCHWKWISSQSDSSFAQVAKLKHVWWLEIRGRTETTILSPKTTYVAYLVIKFTKDDGYGLNMPPTDVLVEFIAGGGTASGARTVYLDPKRRPHVQPSPFSQSMRMNTTPLNPINSLLSFSDEALSNPYPEGRFPSNRKDGWMKIEVGEFNNDHGDDGEVQMTLKEIKGFLKRGLIVQGIELRPKGE